MSEHGYELRFDAEHRVILFTAEKRLTEEIYLAGYNAIKNFVATHGPCSIIVDFSFVETFGLSSQFVHDIAIRVPAIPAPMKRVVVATLPEIYNAFCIFEAVRSPTALPVAVVPRIDDAYEMCGASATDFAPIDA